MSSKITTNNNSNTIFTANNITSQFTISPTPFSISFSWDNKSVSITLKDGNDIFKIAKGIMEWMDTNEIEYKIKTTGKKKK